MSAYGPVPTFLIFTLSILSVHGNYSVVKLEKDGTGYKLWLKKYPSDLVLHSYNIVRLTLGSLTERFKINATEPETSSFLHKATSTLTVWLKIQLC